jgi:hypothetical protein
MYAGQYRFRGAFFFVADFVFKRAPAEPAPLVAAQGRCHLDTTVAHNPVELVLVAHVAPGKRTLAPHTGFKRS